MAILGEIRKKSWVLIAIVALGLVAFLIDPSSLIGGISQVNTNNYGEVNGDIITKDEYEAAKLLANNQQQNPNNFAIDNMAWNMAVNNKLIEIHAEKAGIFVNDEILYAYYPEIKSEIANLQKAANEGNTQAQANLNNVPKFLEAQRVQLMQNIYNSLLSSTLLSNKIEVAHFSKALKNNVKAEWVKIDYNTYNQKNPVKVTDEDLQKYINEHKLLFKREANVGFKYVFFQNLPSAKDQDIFNKNMSAYLNGGVEYNEEGKVMDSLQSFRTTANDSLYVNQYSLQPFDNRLLSEQEISSIYGKDAGNWVKSAAIGSTFGPYNVAEYTLVSKLTRKGVRDSVQSRRILIGYKGGMPGVAREKADAQQLSNKLLTDIQANPDTFAQLATQYSDDKSTAVNGGNTGWITDNSQEMPEYISYLKKSPTGSYGVVETPVGFFIVNIMEKKQGTSYQLANLIKQSRASKATENQLYLQANKFLKEVKDGSEKDFETKSIALKNPSKNAENITRFQGAISGLNTDKTEDVIKWAFNNDTPVGTTEIFQTTNGDYIIAKKLYKEEAGLAKPQHIRQQYETVVRNEKIALLLEPKLKGKTIDAVAGEYATQKENGDLSFLQLVIPNSGSEPKVVGTVFGLQPNKTSLPIQGVSGVYLIKNLGTVTSQNILPEQAVKQNIEQINKGMTRSILSSLRQEADVKDEREKIFQ